jgi:hypothetical protein
VIRASLTLAVQLAAECILLILSRRFKPDERSRMLGLFEYFDFFWEALRSVTNSDEDYQFSRRLAQVTCLLFECYMIL